MRSRAPLRPDASYWCKAATRRREILDAAQRLFERHGYAATPMAATASEAGVSLKAVYVAFETKRGVLLALWHVLLRGHEKPIPVGERSWFRAVLLCGRPGDRCAVEPHSGRVIRQPALGRASP